MSSEERFDSFDNLRGRVFEEALHFDESARVRDVRGPTGDRTALARGSHGMGRDVQPAVRGHVLG